LELKQNRVLKSFVKLKYRRELKLQRKELIKIKQERDIVENVLDVFRLASV